MRLLPVLSLLSVASLALSGCRAGEVRSATAAAGTAAELARFQALEGEWVRVDESGAPTGELITRFRTTAGGSTVLETLMPGSEMEMLTTYHAQAGDLVLTHYCVLGNQPHMRARPGAGPDELVFECTGLAPEDQAHMHEASYTWLGPDRIRTRWVQHVEGEVGEVVVFELARR